MRRLPRGLPGSRVGTALPSPRAPLAPRRAPGDRSRARSSPARVVRGQGLPAPPECRGRRWPWFPGAAGDPRPRAAAAAGAA